MLAYTAGRCLVFQWHFLRRYGGYGRLPLRSTKGSRQFNGHESAHHPKLPANLYSPLQAGRMSMKQRRRTPGTDDIRINVQDSSELKYWADKFSVSKDTIKSTVIAVGDSLTDVQRQLQLSHFA
jgi:hypothetical protein